MSARRPAWASRPAPTLSGELVRVEPLDRRHEADLFEAGAEAALWRWLPETPIDSPRTFRRWIDEAHRATLHGSEVAFAIVARPSERAVGSTRFLELRSEHARLEIGWTWLTRSVWGSGVNVEAKLLLLEHAFESWGCLRVEFKTDARNLRSRQALAALPARFEGTFRKHMLIQGGESRDSAYFAIIDDEWPDVKRNLQRRVAAHVAASAGVHGARS